MKALALSLLFGAVVALSSGCGNILGFQDPTLETGAGGASAGASGQGGFGDQAGDTQTTAGGHAGGAAAGGAGKGGMPAGGAGEGGLQSGEAGAGEAAGMGGTTGQAGGGVGGSAGQLGKGCGVGHLIISQVRTRGTAGAGDEFVELYNATSAAVKLDATWTIDARSPTAASFGVRWTGTGATLAAYGHFLIVGTSYTQLPAADVQLASGFTDASSLRLLHGNTPVDIVCFAFSASSTQALTTDASFQCPGMPASNLPHNDTTAGNSDVSLARKARSGSARCLDSGNNANDFESLTPAAPLDVASAPTP